MNILVINCGSSSLKYQLINSDTEAVLAKGLCERIGIEGSQITYQPAGGEKEVTVSPMPTHTQAIQMVLDALTNKKSGVIASLTEVGAVGHRVVHGGEKFTSSTVITDEAMKAIEECNDLAPLPRWQTMIFKSSYGFPATSAALLDTKLWDVPWKPYLLTLYFS